MVGTFLPMYKMGFMRQNNKFAIIINDYKISKWQKQILDDLNKLGFELVLIVKPKKEIESTQLNFRQKAYLKFLAFANKSELSEIIDISDIRAECQELNCNVIRKGKYSQYFLSNDLDIIKGHNLFFILKFGMGIIRGEINNCAELGVWSFHHGNPNYYKGGPPIFWEKFYNEKSIGVFLQRINDKLDAGSTLSLETYPIKNKNITEIYDLIYEASIEQLKELLMLSKEIKPKNRKYNGKIYSFPKISQLLYFILFIHLPQNLLCKRKIHE